MAQFINNSLTIIIVDKGGSLKTLNVKDYKEEDLYKKCGFKKADGFILQHEWSVKCEKQKYYISIFAKTDGKANCENKYDFPPPIDNKLFFGSCAIIGALKNENGVKQNVNLSIPLWDKLYENLFGGFEDINSSALILEDENEEDELANIPAEKKTKQGYLKDGFVVDSDSVEDEDYESDEEESEEVSDENEEECEDEDKLMIDIGSELSEEEYDYDGEDSDSENSNNDKKKKKKA
jgi:hypothetical protein